MASHLLDARLVESPDIACGLQRRVGDEALVDGEALALGAFDGLKVHRRWVGRVGEEVGVGVGQHIAHAGQCALAAKPGFAGEDLDAGTGFGEDDAGLHDPVLRATLIFYIAERERARRRVVGAEHVDPVHRREVAWVDDFEETQRPAGE